MIFALKWCSLKMLLSFTQKSIDSSLRNFQLCTFITCNSNDCCEFFGYKVNILSIKNWPQRFHRRQNLSYIWSQFEWQKVSFLIRYQRKMIDREMIYRLRQEEKLINSKSSREQWVRADHALKCQLFSSDDVQYLASWWALLTFKNIILNGHCIQNSIYELIS